MTTRNPHLAPFLPLAALLGAFLVFGLFYIWATPPFEASDELWHFGMVDTIAQTGQLPVQQPGVETVYEQEGSQPPLYYAISALLVLPLDRRDFPELREANPHARPGIPGDQDNKNLVLHAPNTPLEKTALAVLIVRLFSLILGAVTVICVYAVGWLVSGARQTVALLAAALTAFNPMFLFISASVNNDNLVIALNSLVIVLLLRMMARGFDTKRSIAISVLVALASLTKLSGLVLVPVIALAALWLAYRQRNLRGLVFLGGSMLIAWLVLAGWWYARNLTLYGELFGTSTMVAVAGPRTTAFTLQSLVNEFEGFRVAYWGWFGALSITAESWLYRLYDLFTAAAVIGFGLFIVRDLRSVLQRMQVLALLLALMIGSLAVIQWTAQTYASQGRLLFPFLGAISPLLALGWTALSDRLPERFAVGHWLPAAGSVLAALLIPFMVIAPAYQPPMPLAELPADIQPVFARYGDIDLVGYRTNPTRYEPGDYLPITVYWRVNATSTTDLSLYLHAVDDAGEVIGRIDSFPGGGRLRTSTWAPGLYADDYAIPLRERTNIQSNLRVLVGWWHYVEPDQAVVNPTDENGSRLASVMLNAGGFAGSPVLPTRYNQINPINFGGMIELIGWQESGETLTLIWRAAGTPNDTYTVFVQALDASNQVVVSGDAPPRLSTRFWRAGETYTSTHNLVFSPSDQPTRLIVGWYHPQTFERLPSSTPDNAAIVRTY